MSDTDPQGPAHSGIAPVTLLGGTGAIQGRRSEALGLQPCSLLFPGWFQGLGLEVLVPWKHPAGFQLLVSSWGPRRWLLWDQPRALVLSVCPGHLSPGSEYLTDMSWTPPLRALCRGLLVEMAPKPGWPLPRARPGFCRRPGGSRLDRVRRLGGDVQTGGQLRPDEGCPAVS